MANVKNLAEELAGLTAEEMVLLNNELFDLNASVSVSGEPPKKLPPIGGGFPGVTDPNPDGEDLRNDPIMP